MNTKELRMRELFLFYLLPIIAVGLSIATKANYPITLLLFWGLPSLMLSFLAKNHVTKAALFAIACSVLFIPLDLVFYISKQWYVFTAPTDYRLFGIVAWEDIIFFFLWIYFPVLFWEHFYEKNHNENNWSKKMTKLTIVFLFVSIIILSSWALAPHLLQIPYFYLLCLLLIGVLPIAIETVFKPKLSFKFIKIGIYFAYVGILYELTALYLVQWNYPSTEFVGWIEIIGLKFPIEELFAWIILGSTGILTIYEAFDDDQK